MYAYWVFAKAAWSLYIHALMPVTFHCLQIFLQFKSRGKFLKSFRIFFPTTSLKNLNYPRRISKPKGGKILRFCSEVSLQCMDFLKALAFLIHWVLNRSILQDNQAMKTNSRGLYVLWPFDSSGISQAFIWGWNFGWEYLIDWILSHCLLLYV